MSNDEEKNDVENSNKVIELHSTKKFIVAGKIITMSSKREAQDLADEEKLSKEELKERIVLGIKKNGEEKIEEEKETKRFSCKRIIPLVLIPIMLLSMVKGCSKDNIQTVIETKNIHEIVYQLENPYPILEGIVNSAGQEGMTANGMEGSAFSGNHYEWTEQVEAEQSASSGTLNFEQMQKEIDENLEKLTSENTTQEEKETAARYLLKLSETAHEIFENNEEFAKLYTEKFKEASNAYKDSNTENEIVTIDKMIENYMAELGLSSQNVEAIKNIVDAFEQGYELKLEGEELADGDFIITGEGIREVAVEEGINKSTWQKFKDFIKGDREQQIDKQNTDSFEK